MNDQDIHQPGGAFDPKRYLITVQGNRKYLPVSARLIWFRRVNPDWGIETTPLCIDGYAMTTTGEVVRNGPDGQYAIFQARVYNAAGKLMAMGTKREDVKGFPDYTEKAESGAIGRALALCGFGTQFCPDLDETRNERYADSPQRGGRPEQNSQRPQPRNTNPPVTRAQAFGSSAQAAPAATSADGDPGTERSEADARRHGLNKECGALIRKLPQDLQPEVQGMILTKYEREFRNLSIADMEDLLPRLKQMVKWNKPNSPTTAAEAAEYMRMTNPDLYPPLAMEIERVWGTGEDNRERFMTWLAAEFRLTKVEYVVNNALKNVMDALANMGDTANAQSN